MKKEILILTAKQKAHNESWRMVVMNQFIRPHLHMESNKALRYCILEDVLMFRAPQTVSNPSGAFWRD